MFSQVRDAGDDAKRSFLLRKGLSEAEINEAFERVRASSSALTGPKNQDSLRLQGPVSGPSTALAGGGEPYAVGTQQLAVQKTRPNGSKSSSGFRTVGLGFCPQLPLGGYYCDTHWAVGSSANCILCLQLPIDYTLPCGSRQKDER